MSLAVSQAPNHALEVAMKAAEAAHLRYTSDETPGIRRKRSGTAFVYSALDGKRITDEEELARIRKLAVPPAYEDVWICADDRGHLQATGRDARGRKQYRYHADWRAVRDESKYGRMIELGRILPKVRKTVQTRLDEKHPTKDWVLSLVVHLLDTTLIRVGNEEYARENRSYGLTTLLAKHVALHNGAVKLAFRGKSGVEHQVTVSDRRVARALQRCMQLPGRELFQYVDDNGDRHTVDSTDVNEHLRRLTGADITAKDYRTWAGSVLAMKALREQKWSSATDAKRKLVETYKQVASRLRNTPAVCKKCYVHPHVVQRYLAGSLFEIPPSNARQFLSADEVAFLNMLSSSAAAEPRSVARAPRRRRPSATAARAA